MEKTLLSEQGQSSLAMPGNKTREHWSIGELSKIPLSAGSIGIKTEDYDVFLFLYLALLHYSIIPERP